MIQSGANLFNGVVSITDEKFYGGCSGFLLEGDIIVTAGHCLSGDDFNSLHKDASIDYEKLKTLKVYFGDARFDLVNDIAFFNERSKPYSIKDVFLGSNEKDCQKGVKVGDSLKDDFAFIKLNEPIPKKYKRFKLLKDINFKDYKFLDQKFQKGLSISTVGYPGDIIGTEKLAHVGCKVRSSIQYKGTWSLNTDCDVEGGQSGSPAFRILENKKTKEIELGILGIFIAGAKKGGRSRHFTSLEKYINNLASRPQYHFYSSDLEKDLGQYSLALSLNNHLFFNEILEGFKKDSSQWRNRKVPFLKKYNYLKEDYLKTKIKSYDIKKLKEFLNFLEKHKISRILTCDNSLTSSLLNIAELDDLKEEKKEILNNFVEKIEIQEREGAKKLLNKRKKHLSYKNIMKAYGVSLLKENGEPKEKDDIESPLEDLEKDKEQSDKLWHDYFGE